MTATATNVNVFDADIAIDTTIGTFNSDNLKFQDQVSSTNHNGEITGTFTGSNAAGIAGVYSTDDNKYFGAIAGER